MQITIRDDIESRYVGRITTGHISAYDASWVAVLRLLAGRTLEIDTKFLFRDQLNTEGLPADEVESLLATLPETVSDKCRERCHGALTKGIRAMYWMHTGVDGDVRPTRKLCRWCHHHSDKSAGACGNCGKTDHFETLS